MTPATPEKRSHRLDWIVLALLLGLGAYWQFTRGTAWMAGAKFAQTEAAFESAIQEGPGHYQARHNLASPLAKRGDTANAIQHWQSVIATHPEEAPGLGGLGAALLVVERPQKALPYLQRAVELQPTTAEFRANLARVLLMLGDGEGALRELQRTATLEPDDPNGWRALAGMAQAQGNTRLALQGWQQALQLQADPYIANNIAWVMATHPQQSLRDGPQALQLATTACEATDYRVRPLLDTLAAAQAEVGQFSKAVTTSQRSLAMAAASEDSAATTKIKDRIRLYEMQQPYRDQQLP